MDRDVIDIKLKAIKWDKISSIYYLQLSLLYVYNIIDILKT